MTNTSRPLTILETQDLASIVTDQAILPVAVMPEKDFLAGHIPDSQLIQPAELVSGIKPATGKLPAQEKLDALFSRIGLRPDIHVVAYDNEGGGWAGRLIWTLDILGHQHYSYLNGGLTAWQADSQTLAIGAADNIADEYKSELHFEARAELQDVLDQLDDANSIVWDARSPEEYAGTKVTALRNGHIPNARNLDWLELMDRNNALRLRPLEEIANRLVELGISKEKSVVTHCQTHHRSGLTYLVGRALGLNIKAYDGSWSEWGNHPDTPIET